MQRRRPSREREVVCLICGRRFMTRHSQAKYCPDICRRLAMRSSWRKYGERNREKRRAYIKKHYEKNKEERDKQIRKYQKSKRGKEVINKSSKNMQKKYSEKYKARYLTRIAIEKGILKKQPCVICKKVKAQAHHKDYNKPLDILWLCQKHHRLLEAKQKENKR